MNPILQDAIKKLTPFADPHAGGRHLSIEEKSATSVDVHMVCRGEPLAFAVEVVDEAIQLSRHGEVRTLREFLAADLADLNSLAAIESSYWHDNYIDSAGSVQESGKTGSALTLLNGLVREQRGATQIVFVTAAAGGGKSRTLQRLTHVGAKTFAIDDMQARLFLYVDAQARALARFDEALAVALDQFRSRLTFDQVIPLVRENLLVVVVDGFDELLETGKVDTVASLTDFVRELGGDGAIVLSGRSAYYESEFGTRIANDVGTWELSRLEVLGWDLPQTEEFLAGEGSDLDARQVFESASLLSDGRRASPFFVATLVDLKLDTGAGLGTVSALVSALAKREAELKLRDLSGAPILSTNALLDLVEDIGVDLWLAETRYLKDRDLREVVAAVVPTVQSELFRYVQQRGPFLAFFTAEQGRVAFRHEIWFEYFVARHIAKRLENDLSALKWILPRAPCSQTIADLAILDSGSTAAYADGSRVRDLQTLVFVGEKRQTLARDNVARLCAAAMRSAHTISQWTIEDLSFSDEEFQRLLTADLVLRRCAFVACDFRNTTLSASTERVLFDRARVNDQTRLSLTGDYRIASMVTDATIYSPKRIAEWVAAHGGSAASRPLLVRQEVLDLLERLATQLQTRNVFWPDDDWFTWLSRHPDWQSVRQILEATEVMVLERSENRRAPRDRLHTTVKLAELVQVLCGEPTSDAVIQESAAQLSAQFPPQVPG